MGRDNARDDLNPAPTDSDRARIEGRFQDGTHCAPTDCPFINITNPVISRFASWPSGYYNHIRATLQRYELDTFTFDWHGNWQDPFNQTMASIAIELFLHGINNYAFNEDLKSIPHTDC